MWTGATRGLATLKFSTSPKRLGAKDVRVIIIRANKIRGVVSLIRNKGLNFTLSVLNLRFEGFVEPFSWSRIRCTRTSAATTIGRIKCREKNRFSVGLDTEGPPQIQVTRSFPTNGMADRTPVITVAPQNDICPQGRTYPRKAVAINARRMIVPESHTFFWFMGELK